MSAKFEMQAFQYEDGELVVDSRLIAQRLGIEHRSLLETIDTYQTQMERAFGVLRFQTAKPSAGSKGGRPSRYTLLTEDQATFLMTLSRNTLEVIQCKIDLVQAFSKAKTVLKKQRFVDATLKVYLLDDPVKWRERGRVFQEDFYREIYRLNGWQFTTGKTRHPLRVAQFTIDIVYERLQPGVWEQMTKRNPRRDGRRKHCCHQFLSDNIGNPHLKSHLYAVTKLMRGCQNWHQFMSYLNRFYPKCNELQMDILFDLLAASPEDFDRWNGLVS